MKECDLKRQIEEVEKEILEDNEEWYDNFISQNYPDFTKQQAKKNEWSPRRRRNLWIWMASCVTVAAIVVTMVLLWPVIFSQPDPNPINPKKYEIENEDNIESNMLELNSDLTKFTIDIAANYEIKKMYRYFDTKYDETLYYRVEFKDEATLFEAITIYVYVNPDYENRKEPSESIKTTLFNEFFISYEKIVNEDDGLFTINYFALAEYGEFAIYIEYEQMSLDENSNFFNFFEQTFIIN